MFYFQTDPFSLSLVSCDLSEMFKLTGLVKCQFSGKNISSHAAENMTYFVGGRVISRTVSFSQIPGLMVLGSACVNPSEACHVPATATPPGQADRHTNFSYTICGANALSGVVLLKGNGGWWGLESSEFESWHCH